MSTECGGSEMQKSATGICVGCFAILFVCMLSLAWPAAAQQLVNPTADAVKEEQLLQQLQRVEGRITIPDRKESVLIQPAGRDWRAFHEQTLYWTGAVAIVGMLALLVFFYLRRGMIR